MSTVNQTKRKFRIFIFALFLISIISIIGIVVYAMQSVNIPLEVKEPLEIIDYPTSFSLYSGETTTFEFTIENYAQVTYFQEFDFTLNDTDYQNRYVTFSNHNYSIPPGSHTLSGWLTIAPSAPVANLIITINKKTESPTPTPIPNLPLINQTNTSLNPTLQLLAGGATWAAQEGKSALYINWLDNWKTHHTTDGIDWEYSSEATMNICDKSVLAALEYSGFEITLAGNIPEDLSGYDVVVIYAYYAVEPRHEPLIREYIYNGGSVVFLVATQNYLESYSKSYGCATSFDMIEDWFGASKYVNTAGNAHVAFDNPFGTLSSVNDVLFVGSPNYSSYASVSSLRSGTKVVAFWDSGKVFAFTHEFGGGRVYYQATFEYI